MQSTINIQMAPGVSVEDLKQQLSRFYEVIFIFNLHWLFFQQPLSGPTTLSDVNQIHNSLLAVSARSLCKPIIPLNFTKSNLFFIILQNEEFVAVLPDNQAPHTKYVQGSNACHINVFPDRIPGRAIIISVVCVYYTFIFF